MLIDIETLVLVFPVNKKTDFPQACNFTAMTLKKRKDKWSVCT